MCNIWKDTISQKTGSSAEYDGTAWTTKLERILRYFRQGVSPGALSQYGGDENQLRICCRYASRGLESQAGGVHRSELRRGARQNGLHQKALRKVRGKTRRSTNDLLNGNFYVVVRLAGNGIRASGYQNIGFRPVSLERSGLDGGRSGITPFISPVSNGPPLPCRLLGQAVERLRGR